MSRYELVEMAEFLKREMENKGFAHRNDVNTTYDPWLEERFEEYMDTRVKLIATYLERANGKG
jgi:hypothetical protein